MNRPIRFYKRKEPGLKGIYSFGCIFCALVISIFIWIIIFKSSRNYVFILFFSIGVIVALVMVIASIIGYFSITFIKVYENGIALPEKNIHNISNDEEFILYSKIKMIKVEQRFLIVKKLIIEGFDRESSYFGDLKNNVIDIDRFLQVLYELKNEGKVDFIETEDKPFYR